MATPSSRLIKCCRRSSVSFSPTSKMCLVSRHDNKSDLFYSALELQIIKLRSMHDSYNLLECNIIGEDIVDMLKNVTDTSAFLGLEHCLSKSTYIKRTQKRRSSIEAVISEHHRQLSLGVNDPTTLANISATESAWARERARTLGLLHSEEEARF